MKNKEFKGSEGYWFVRGLSVVSMPSQVHITNYVLGANYEEACANAALIAVAPELLKELINLKQKLHYLATESDLCPNLSQEYYDECIKAGEAIYKALNVKS